MENLDRKGLFSAIIVRLPSAIASPMLFGIIIGIIGMLMTIVNYPIYKRLLGKRRKKYADKIIALSDNIMKG